MIAWDMNEYFSSKIKAAKQSKLCSKSERKRLNVKLKKKSKKTDLIIVRNSNFWQKMMKMRRLNLNLLSLMLMSRTALQREWTEFWLSSWECWFLSLTCQLQVSTDEFLLKLHLAHSLARCQECNQNKTRSQNAELPSSLSGRGARWGCEDVATGSSESFGSWGKLFWLKF